MVTILRRPKTTRLWQPQRDDAWHLKTMRLWQPQRDDAWHHGYERLVVGRTNTNRLDSFLRFDGSFSLLRNKHSKRFIPNTVHTESCPVTTNKISPTSGRDQLRQTKMTASISSSSISSAAIVRVLYLPNSGRTATVDSTTLHQNETISMHRRRQASS